MGNEIVKQDEQQFAIVEQVVVSGNLTELTPAQRVQYYNRVCESLGLNPYTKPFDYITLNGKLTLYARKDATEQLRRIQRISITGLDAKLVDDLYIVNATAMTPDGRIDQATGAVSVNGLKGESKANAIMKAETKAKRRVTLSICGLGWTDESEVDSIPGAQRVSVNMDTGEIVTATAKPQQAKQIAQKPASSNAEIDQGTQGPQQEVDFYPDGEQLFSRDTEPAPPRASREQQNQFHAIGTKIYGAGPAWDAARHKLVEEITTGATTSSNDLTPGECNELMLTMLGKAAFGDEWSAKAEALCKAANVVSLRQLPPATVKTSLTKLQKQLEGAPAAVGK